MSNRTTRLPNDSRSLVWLAGLMLVAAACYASFRSAAGDALVVYCAHDSVYSEALLQDFEMQSGIDVVMRFDTEATKSLGLVNLLMREQRNPRCDVFWNNELLGTLDLQDAGLLVPYQGSNHARFPEKYKDRDGHWTGFGGRLRVWIRNAQQSQQEVGQYAATPPYHDMAFANPLYGTTRTHFTVLWHHWGEERIRQWHRAITSSGALSVQGNAMVKNVVVAGTKPFGWTDTDDYYVAQDAGAPVDMEPVRLESGETVCIPNTVAIIKGTQRLPAAKKLVDFLLSESTEIRLSKSRARQIPLGTCDRMQLSKEVSQLCDWAEESVDLRECASSRADCLDWLKAEYLR